MISESFTNARKSTLYFMIKILGMLVSKVLICIIIVQVYMPTFCKLLVSSCCKASASCLAGPETSAWTLFMEELITVVKLSCKIFCLVSIYSFH